jgi:predicted  nucleic acid-binding Zn-ribbon protein
VRRVTDLEPLLVLQEHDLAIDRLRHDRATIPERDRLVGVSSQLAELATTRADKTLERDEIARQEQRLADEAQHLGQQIIDAERRLYSGEVSSPRELQALQADVEQLRRRRGTVEDRELAAMEQREPLDHAIGELDAARKDLEGAAGEMQQELTRREGEIDAALAAQRAERDQVAAGIPPSFVADYERRRARARGVGAARLVGSTCQGCHLSIPATEVDRIYHQPPGTLSYCDNCGCILVP